MDKKNIYIIGQKKTRKSIEIISILAISFFIGIVLATNASAVMSNWAMDINVNSTDAAGNLLESKINFGVDTIATDGYDGAPFDIDAAPISPTGFDLRFSEPGVSTGELSKDTKAVGESKSWTFLAQAPKARKMNIKWFSAKIPANVEMQIQELDLKTGSPIGLPINMKSIDLINYKAGVFSNLQKGYIITANATPISGIDGTLDNNAVGTFTPKNTITGNDGISSFIFNATSTGTRILELLNDLIFGTVAIIVLEPK